MIRKLYSPHGDFSPEPSEEEALGYLALPYEDYAWGSGDVAIWYAANDTEIRLVLTMSPDERFLVTQVNETNGEQFFASHTERSSSWVTLNSGGDSFDVGDRFLLNRDQASAVIRAFWTTGGRTPALNWEEHAEMTDPY